MGDCLVPIHHRRLDEVLVNAAAIAMFANVAERFRQQVQEFRFQIAVGKFIGELDHPSRILQHLHRFNPRQFVKEPSAACVHQHGMPLQFHELEHGDFV